MSHAVVSLDIEAANSRLLTAMQIRMELLRDKEALREAFEGYKAFACHGKKGRRLSELKRK